MRITITTDIGGKELHRNIELDRDQLEDDTFVEETTGKACNEMIQNIISSSEPY